MLPYREPPQLWKLVASLFILAVIGSAVIFSCVVVVKALTR